MSEEIKPVGEIKYSDLSGLYVRFDHKSQVKVGANVYALPATHRIVPVELLRLWIATADEMPPKLYDRLRAIIDKEPT